MSDDEDGYQGPATLLLDDTEVEVTVMLRGNFEPVDGRYHWYGRVEVNETLAKLLENRKANGVLRTPVGEAAARLTDQDTWGRYRISGTSRPPFPIPTSLADLPEEA